MPFFRKKPVVIEARQLTKDNLDEMIAWISSNNKNCYYSRDRLKPLVIQTPEGDHQATIGDWIIKGVKGEFYPCKPDIFEMTYTAALLRMAGPIVATEPLIKNND